MKGAGRAIPAALVVGLALGGCSARARPTPAPAPVHEQTRSPGPADPRLLAHEVSGPWKLVASDPAGPDLTLRVAEGACLHYLRLVVDERPGDVTVTSVLRDTTRPWVVCNASLVTREVTVRLEGRLGRRALVHAYVAPSLGLTLS